MPRTTLIAGLLMFFAAALMAAANPAFAHGLHTQSAAASEERLSSSADQSAPFKAGPAAAPEIAPPAGEMWFAPASNPDGGTDSCHGEPICCMSHCSVGSALTAKPVEQPSVISATRVDLAMAEQPDDAPLQTRLRPPCR